MQTCNDITTVQDTSTQAMTEVALGLSMAFFALLIIALMSATLPSTDATSVKDSHTNSQTIKHANVDISEQVDLSIQNKKNGHDDVAVETSANEIILLYWGGQFFDTQQQIVNIENVITQQNVIVAVDPKIPFNQLIDVQAQFAGKTLRLTQLSEQWQVSLSQIRPHKNASNNTASNQ